MAKATSNKPVLSADKMQCDIGDFCLRVNTTVDYKPAADERLSMGKIDAFKHPGYSESDKQSVWMNIVDMTNDQQREWVSVSVWYEQHLERNKPQPSNNGNTKPANTGNLPF